MRPANAVSPCMRAFFCKFIAVHHRILHARGGPMPSMRRANGGQTMQTQLGLRRELEGSTTNIRNRN